MSQSSDDTDDTDDIRRLRWQCRRGMLELDYLFESFLDRHYRDLDPGMKAEFIALLEHPDPVLHAWCIVGDQPEERRWDKLIQLIRQPV